MFTWSSLRKTMTKRKFYKTTYKVTVLSEGAPVSPDADLEVVLREITDGEWIGEVEYEGSDEIPATKIEKELIDVGNDGSFFDTGDDEEKIGTGESPDDPKARDDPHRERLEEVTEENRAQKQALRRNKKPS